MRQYGDKEESPNRFVSVGLALIAVLAAASLGYNMTRPTGPPPEFEAQHSAAEALGACRRGLDAELPGVDPDAGGLLAAEYLGGGEYEVRGPVAVTENGRRVTAPVLCEALYLGEEGWRVDVELRP